MEKHSQATRNYKKCVICHKRRTPSSNFFLAKIPQDPVRCRMWIKAIGQEDLAYLPIEKLHALKFVCRDHFRQEDFNVSKTRLLKHAVPSLNLPLQPLEDSLLENFPLYVGQYPAQNHADSQATTVSDHQRECESVDITDIHTTDENDYVTDSYVCSVCDTDEDTFVTDPANFETLQYVLREEPIPELWLCKWCAAYLYKVDELVHWYRAKKGNKQKKGILHNFLQIHNAHIDIPPDGETDAKQKNISSEVVNLEVDSDIEEEALVLEEDSVFWTQHNVYDNTNAQNVTDDGSNNQDIVDAINDTVSVIENVTVETSDIPHSDNESINKVNTENSEKEIANEKVGVKRKRRHAKTMDKELGSARVPTEEQPRQSIEKSKEIEKDGMMKYRRVGSLATNNELRRVDTCTRPVPPRAAPPAQRGAGLSTTCQRPPNDAIK